jgi:hypothetical protein
VEPASKTIKRRGPLGWIDRRLVRSALYGLVLVILFLLFKTTEWLIDHYLSTSKNHGLIAALSVAVGLAIVFQLFHKRIEHAVEGWLHRGLHEREKGSPHLLRKSR